MFLFFKIIFLSLKIMYVFGTLLLNQRQNYGIAVDVCDIRCAGYFSKEVPSGLAQWLVKHCEAGGRN